MKLLDSLFFTLYLTSAAAYPLSNAKRDMPSMPGMASMPSMASGDVTILQFALTLEHLENTFYKKGLSQFSEKDFTGAGFSSSFFESVQFTAADEQTHVELLTTAISAAGQTPVAPCEYKFPFTDVKSFITLSSVLEGVGASAYLGAAGLVMDRTILTTAASIMVNEALHTSTQREAVGLVPAPNPLGTPLDANSVFTLAASFITSCPSSNAPLPFVAFASLTLSSDSPSSCDSSKSSETSKSSKEDKKSGSDSKNSKDDSSKSSSSSKDCSSSSSSGNLSEGDTIVLVADTSKSQMPSEITSVFVTFVSGLTTISVQATSIDKAGSKVSAHVPSGVSGQTFVFITNAAIGTVIDQAVLFGPAAVEVNAQSPQIDDKIL